MPKFTLYQVDAFANQVFFGNPAAVLPLEEWLDDKQLQHIAMENNLSETAFFVPEKNDAPDDFHIRWFTPETEVRLCGHATLASAWVLFNRLEWPQDSLRFRSRSGSLGVTRKPSDWYELDFPRLSCKPVTTPELIRQSIDGSVPDTAFFVPDDTNYLVVLKNEAAVRRANPDLRRLKSLGNQGLIITAPGDHCDFVSRYFAPGAGIDEDPVTGSIHSVLAPFWAEKIGKNTLLAHQISYRGGALKCEVRDERVAIAGQAAPYMEGVIEI